MSGDGCFTTWRHPAGWRDCSCVSSRGLHDHVQSDRSFQSVGPVSLKNRGRDSLPALGLSCKPKRGSLTVVSDTGAREAVDIADAAGPRTTLRRADVLWLRTRTSTTGGTRRTAPVAKRDAGR